jgi:hypothetical protein
MMRFTIDTFYCFDGQTEEDIQVTFDYIKGFRGDMTDPPHGDEIDIMEVRRNDYPNEELDTAEWNAVCDDERISQECIQYAREEIMDAAEARRDAREDR